MCDRRAGASSEINSLNLSGDLSDPVGGSDLGPVSAVRLRPSHHLRPSGSLRAAKDQSNTPVAHLILVITNALQWPRHAVESHEKNSRTLGIHRIIERKEMRC